MPKVIPQLLIPPARYPQYRGTLHIETHRTALVSNHPFPLGAFTSERDDGRWTCDFSGMSVLETAEKRAERSAKNLRDIHHTFTSERWRVEHLELI